MNGTAHAGLAVLSLVFVAAVFVIRYAITPVVASGRHRPVRVRPVAEYVPGCFLIPAQQYTADCPDCGSNITINTRTGDR